MSKTFTFFAEGDRVEVRIVEVETHSKRDDSDAVWLDSTVTVQAGAFLGSFKASFKTDDLVSLHEQLRSVLTTLSGTVFCKNTSGGLSMVISLNGDGRASITGVAQPNRLRHGTLHFQIATDRFGLIRTFHELEATLRMFPPKRNNQEQRYEPHLVQKVELIDATHCFRSPIAVAQSGAVGRVGAVSEKSITRQQAGLIDAKNERSEPRRSR
jgi:hypothetical protein